MATASAVQKTPGVKEFTARFARGMAVGMLPGALAGLIAGGVGSRLAMRMMAATSTAAVQGTETEFGATVGEISFGGTLFLFIAGAILGAGGGLIYMGSDACCRGAVGLGAWLSVCSYSGSSGG